VVIFEGWCVGARPQSDEALATPINALERDEDADGRWRGYVNGKLAQDYGSLFGLIDMLVFLRAPSFECVYDWRKKQERKLADKVRHTGGATRIMNDAELKRFIMHYERLTRHILSTMPGYADVVFELNERQQIIKRV
jgi:D-glycerate 3-kinase